MKAYAKLNLLLHVLNKRDDGYHNLQMVNTKINLFDNIYIIRNNQKEDTIKSLNLNDYITDDNNLILKVAKKFKEKYNINVCYNIEIEKNIPFGSGLGGVSVDVAAVIKYIAVDNNINITIKELIDFTLPFGADIPYGFFDKPAIVEGIGDIITEIELYSKDLILVIPDIYISTPIVFKNQLKFSKKVSHDELISSVLNNKRDNDLEITSRKFYTEFDKIVNELSKYGKVVMSGSGSSLTIEPNEDINKTIDILKETYSDLKIYKIQTKEG